MKKTALSLGLVAIALSSVANAGTMGPVQMSAPPVVPFIGLEGAYTWAHDNGFDFNIFNTLRLNSTQDRNGWGGRLSAGLIHQLTDVWAVSSELGYGYYGKTTFHPHLTSDGGIPESVVTGVGNVGVKTTQDGFDALAGIMYTQPSYDLFFKAGALVQNNRSTINSDLPSATPAVGSFLYKSNQTQVLPEIKLGGAYHVTEQLSITAAWAHAFGSTPKATATVVPANLQTTVNVNTQNPSMDSALVGLQYKFG